MGICKFCYTDTDKGTNCGMAFLSEKKISLGVAGEYDMTTGLERNKNDKWQITVMLWPEHEKVLDLFEVKYCPICGRKLED